MVYLSYPSRSGQISVLHRRCPSCDPHLPTVLDVVEDVGSSASGCVSFLLMFVWSTGWRIGMCTHYVFFAALFFLLCLLYVVL